MNYRQQGVKKRSRPGQFKRYFTAWILQHLQAFIASLGQLFRNPIASLLTASVIGIALALPTGFYVILENARQVTSGWEGSIQVTAFLKLDVDEKQAEALADQLEQRDDIRDVELITRAEALEEYRRLSGFADAIDVLEENPLPALLLIRPQLDGLSSQAADELLAALGAMPEIENAQYDQQWVQRLHAIIEIVQRLVLILAVFLALAVLLIVGNTIRMSIYHRREEIEVAKLFGATNGFIQRPFLYSGLWYGLAGGLLACILVGAALLFLQHPADALARLYSGEFELEGLDLRDILLVLGTGILLGLLGSWVSVQRHLRAIEPA